LGCRGRRAEGPQYAYADCRVRRIYAGTNEIMKESIGRTIVCGAVLGPLDGPKPPSPVVCS
jgi:hypothetical protein